MNAVLGQFDYQDRFVADIAGLVVRPATDWARAMLEEAPPAMRRFLLTGWAGLGLQLPPRDPRRVLGWRVAEDTGNLVVLAERSGLGFTANLVFGAEPGRLEVRTLIRYDRSVMRPVWTVVALLHQRIVPYLMAKAVARG